MTTRRSSWDRQDVVKVLGEVVGQDVNIGSLTTYRVGGPACLFAEVAAEADLCRVQKVVPTTGVPVVVLGKGSNLLVADAGFDGLAVALGNAFAGIEVEGDRVRAGGAAGFPVVARRSVAAGLAGMEWAVGIPGSVGGAVRMNAGGHGSETSEVLLGARVVDLSGKDGGWVAAADLGLAYRESRVAADQVVTEAEFLLHPGDRKASEVAIADIVRWRRENQPGGQNAGSVFTNPLGDSAGRLVEAAGLKGWRRGSAQVSTKHANFVQADPGGSADDVRALIEEVREMVLQRLGVELELEVQLVGWQGTGVAGR